MCSEKSEIINSMGITMKRTLQQGWRSHFRTNPLWAFYYPVRVVSIGDCKRWAAEGQAYFYQTPLFHKFTCELVFHQIEFCMCICLQHSFLNLLYDHLSTSSTTRRSKRVKSTWVPSTSLGSYWMWKNFEWLHSSSKVTPHSQGSGMFCEISWFRESFCCKAWYWEDL